MNAQKRRAKCFTFLKEHKVLNTMEVCRLLNNQKKDQYGFCNDGLEFGARRVTEHSAGWCNYKENNCSVVYRDVHRALEVLEERHFIYSRKMRFWDKGQALPTDIFRFWFIYPYDFGELVLRQTLIPYVEAAEG